MDHFHFLEEDNLPFFGGVEDFPKSFLWVENFPFLLVELNQCT